MPESLTNDPRLLGRRDFLKKAGIATGAAAALYVAPQFISTGPRPAYAAGTRPCPQVIDFEGFAKGTIITTQLPNITVWAVGGTDQAMIFDTNNPTGGDLDLATPTATGGNEDLGKVLIISEDGDTNDPDDNAGGGEIFFKFHIPVSIGTVKMLDIDGPGDEFVRIKTWDDENGGAGHLISDTGQVAGTGNNTIQTVNVGALGDNVRRMRVKLSSSGAIAEIVCPCP